VPDLIEFRITRDKIPLYSVDAAYMINGETGYIKVDRFSSTTLEEFNTALKKLKSQKMKNLIVDLQDNGGGYMSAAIGMVDNFLQKDQLIVYQEGKAQPRENYVASGKDEIFDGNLVVLVDEGSASASEIVSGAIQDWDRGVIIGRRTFGKGLVQKMMDLPDGSQIRLTTARYHTPTGRCIQRPYKDNIKNYRNDLIERYNHGELMHEDSISFPDSLKHQTLKLKRTIYGGGGIIPDIFVPIDTTKATKFFIDCNRKATMMRFAQSMFDKYRVSLSGIEDFKKLEIYLDSIDLESQFLEYASDVDGIVPARGEWEESRPYMLPQMKALVGRFSKLDNEAFYRFYLPIDDTIQSALENPSEVY
jgi:carboxyl-terminal processing protease